MQRQGPENPVRKSKRDIFIANVCGTAGQERSPEPEFELRGLFTNEIVDRLHPDLHRRLTFGSRDIFPGMNSSNMTLKEHAPSLSKILFEEVRPKYHAAVLIWGTNTGADMGSALALAGIDIPVVLVSGQRHQGRLGSESMSNIEEGVIGAEAAIKQQVAEVMMFSGNEGHELLRAVTSVKYSDNNRRIYISPSTAPLAVHMSHDLLYKPHARRVNPEAPLVHRPHFDAEKVAVFRMHMDFDPRYLEMAVDNLGAAVIILNVYETGNVPDRFLPTIEKIVANGTHVVVVPYFSEPNLTKRMPKEEQNAVMAGANTAPGNITQPALVAKIGQMLAHPEIIEEHGGFEQALNTNFVGEIPQE